MDGIKHTYDRRCRACGDAFVAYRSDAIYCSGKCRVAWCRMRKNEKFDKDGFSVGQLLFPLDEIPLSSPAPKVKRKVSRRSKQASLIRLDQKLLFSLDLFRKEERDYD